MKLTGRELTLVGSINCADADFNSDVCLHQVFADERQNYGYIIVEVGAFPQVTNFNRQDSPASSSTRNPYREPYGLFTYSKQDFNDQLATDLKVLSLAQNNQCLAVYDVEYNSTTIKPNRIITKDLSIGFFSGTQVVIMNYFVVLAEIEITDNEEIVQILKSNAQTVDVRERHSFHNPEPTTTGGA